MKSFLVDILQLFARLILAKYKPTVVGITGSVGKTSTKEAILAVLSSKFSVRASPKNYNNEFGVPLTIIGAPAPGKSLTRWVRVFARALWVIVAPVQYPAILVLEMGADHPKDILKLTNLAPPAVGVVTAVAPVHTEFFGSIKRVAIEKRRLVEAVAKEGTVILNFDDEIVRGFEGYVEGKVMGYGVTTTEAAMRAIEISETIASGGGRASVATEARTLDIDIELGNVRFKIIHNGSAVPVHLPNVLGYQHVYAALAGAAVGRAFGMNMVEISIALLKYITPPGRMRLITGVKSTLLIDDTYNSSPRAAVAALQALGRLSLGVGATRYAILGDMLELGALMESAHREVGRAAAVSAEVLIGVGVSARWIVEEAVQSGMSKDRVFHFQTLEEGVEHFLQECLKSDDVLLIKGSQSMRMEKLVKGLMAEPWRAEELLCRQDKEWMG